METDRQAGLPGGKRHFQGTHRIVAPADTLARIEPLRERFGISRLAMITGLDRIGVPVALAIRPNTRSVAVSVGKGLDHIAARVSALMEAIEFAHAEQIDRPLLLASAEEIGDSRATVPLDLLPLEPGASLSDRQRFLWIEGVDLLAGGDVWLPYELVHAHYAWPPLPGAGTFAATTNGLASGNSLDEAICHGLCETIERDCLSLWQMAPEEVRGETLLDIASIDDPAAVQLIGRLRATGFGVALWDITSDLGVPAFNCLIVDRQSDDGHPGSGSGCHPDRRVALSRALLEAIQVRATYISGSRDDIQRHEYDLAHFRTFQRAYERMTGRPRQRFDAIDFRVFDTHAEDIDWLLSRLRDAGLPSAVVCDLSKEGTGVAVARVVVPGLEPPHRPDEVPQGEDRRGRIAGRS